MKFIIIFFYVKLFILLSFSSLSSSNADKIRDVVPVLLWTSKGYDDRIRLNRNKIITRDLFESHLMKIMSMKIDIEPRPLVLVFLEQFLNPEDFESKTVNGRNSYTFLNDLSINNS